MAFRFLSGSPILVIEVAILRVEALCDEEHLRRSRSAIMPSSSRSKSVAIGKAKAQPKKKPAAVAPPPPPADPDLPEELKCSITFDIMRDPVVCSTGHTYERDALLEHFQTQEKAGVALTCPTTGLATTRDSVQPNWAMRGQLDRFLADNPAWTPSGWDSRKLSPAVAGGGQAGQGAGNGAAGLSAATLQRLTSRILVVASIVTLFAAALLLFRVGTDITSSWSHKGDLRFLGTFDVTALADWNRHPRTGWVFSHFGFISAGWAKRHKIKKRPRESTWPHRETNRMVLSSGPCFLGHYCADWRERCDRNVTFCSKSDTALAPPIRSPNLSDVTKVLANDEHWIIRFLDERHRRVHRSVYAIVAAGKMANRNRLLASASAARQAMDLMRRGLSDLLKLPNFDFISYWLLGQKAPGRRYRLRDCSPLPFPYCTGVEIGSDENSPFAYKNVVEGALYRFFYPLLMVCPLPQREVRLNPFAPRFACARRTGQESFFDVVEQAFAVLLATHLYRPGAKVDQTHTLQSCLDARVDRLVELMSSFMTQHLSISGVGQGYSEALVTAREGVCGYLWHARRVKETFNGAVVEQDYDAVFQSS